MEADWEVEIGGGAPVIEAHWSGFIDLRTHPDRICEIAETQEFPPLAEFLLKLNSDRSPLWTSKCDVWRPEPGGLAFYVDMLPRDGDVFADWKQAETFCRDLIMKFMPANSPAGKAEQSGRFAFANEEKAGIEANLTLVIRQAVTEHSEGFGITVYFSADQQGLEAAGQALARAMGLFTNALAGATFTEGPVQS